MHYVVTAACIFFLVLTSCSKAETPPAPRKVKEGKTLLIGLIPEQNIFSQIERYEPLAEYLSEKTGVRIKLTILPRYGNITDNFVSARMDGAFLGSTTYALAHAKLGVEVLARPVNLEGISKYHGLIFVRKDSSIRSLRDARGKRFAFVDRATTAGYLFPQVTFREAGIPDCTAFLDEAYYSGTHEDAIYDVLNRRADIGAAKNTVYDRLAARDPRIKEEMIVLARSPDVPENGLAVRPDLDKFLKTNLKTALLNMDRDPAGRRVLKGFGALRFIETTDSDYELVYKYARALGMNLSTYSGNEQ